MNVSNNMNMMGMNNLNNMGMMGMNNLNNMGMMQKPEMMTQIMMLNMLEQQEQSQNMMNNFNNMLNMNNINKQMNNMNINNNITKNGISVYFRASDQYYESSPPIMVQVAYDEKVSSMIEKYRNKSGDHDMTKKFIFNAFNIEGIFDSNSPMHQPILERVPNIKDGDHLADLTVEELGFTDNANIFVVITKRIKGAGCPWLQKEINIKFIKNNIKNNKIKGKRNSEIIGLLKLSLLKEISVKLDYNQLKKKKISNFIIYILKLLKKGYIREPDMKENINSILKKIRGSNIINFSRYVDEIINAKELENIISLLGKEDFDEINDIKNRLSVYNDYIKIFDKEFEKAKKESIFEFSIISLAIMEREDFEIFERERNKCPNRVDKILFHGTSIEPISCILTGYFRKSQDKCYQHGKGVYFTDFLDYCWFYGGAESNRANKNKIPKVGDTFTLIASSIYYDQTRKHIVTDYKYTPKKNEINFAYAGCQFETLKEKDLDKTKFIGTEYVIWELSQICPFLGAKLKRNEFCVIWRDNNFSNNSVYNNKFDKIFKDFLKERMKYIQQYANFNIYAFDNSEEALQLIKRKKYNKIILLSNIGPNCEGKTFINKAREIIGNNVIVLFLAYNKAHLNWVTQYKNALFSNSSEFYEEYLECFNEVVCLDYFKERFEVKDKILKIKEKLEKHYNVKFNFDDKFLDFPLYKESGMYSELSF